jgi:small subunit ribosomal protein S17e
LEYRYKKPQSGIGRVDRIKRLSYEVLEQHKSKFGENFTDNKKLLNELAIVRSKGLKNEVAGYITKFIKNEKREEELKQSNAETDESSTIEDTVKLETETEPTTESEETVIEVGVESTDEPKTPESSEEKTE